MLFSFHFFANGTVVLIQNCWHCSCHYTIAQAGFPFRGMLRMFFVLWLMCSLNINGLLACFMSPRNRESIMILLQMWHVRSSLSSFISPCTHFLYLILPSHSRMLQTWCKNLSLSSPELPLQVTDNHHSVLPRLQLFKSLRPWFHILYKAIFYVTCQIDD
jgi:hypothetical protein